MSRENSFPFIRRSIVEFFAGIRANVVAIYEPPQESTRDSVRLVHDQKEELVDQIAESLGLRRVGWIFTDLVPLDLQTGTVKHTRNIDSHFLSAQECMMAGFYQNRHPNPCRYSSSGYFGSKFVTVCVTGKFLVFILFVILFLNCSRFL